jgi:hypothetical protein
MTREAGRDVVYDAFEVWLDPRLLQREADEGVNRLVYFEK